MSLGRRLSWMGLKSWQAGHRTRRRDQRDKRVKPTLTLLEERTLLSTLNLTVTTLLDDPVTPISGQTTLRDAINQANASTDSQEVITFAVDGTTHLTSALPALDNNITIQGPGPSKLTVQRDSSTVPFSVFTMMSENSPAVTVSAMTISGGNATNTTLDDGGGICNWGGNLTVSECTFTGNSDSEGGGIYSGIYNGQTLTVSNCTFSSNSATYEGGGICNNDTATVSNSIFTTNLDSNDDGAGGCIANYGTATVTNCTISGNNGNGEGGGILNEARGSLGTLTVTNSTISGNTGEAGGGICDDGTLTVTNCTISGNTATYEGGGIYNCYNTNNTDVYLTLSNTIVAGNTSNIGTDISGPVQTTSTYNLIGNGSGITNLNQLAQSNLIGTTANPINPMLGPLANNGGPTQTMALLQGSPAINAGSNALSVDASGDQLTTDQRSAGFPRIIGGTVDIGAYESPYLSQTISFGPIPNQTYGVAPITLTASATSNLPVSYTVISGPAIISGDVLTVTGTGNVDVEADQAGNTTYDVATPLDESFIVTPATLTIAANPATKVYGATLPTLTASFVGFVNGDTAASLTTQPILTTAATASSPVLSGVYDIRVSKASDPNYNISYIDGTLTVTPAPLIITANNVVKLYGAALPTLTASYYGFVNGDTVLSLTTAPTLTTTGTANSPVTGNPYPITVSGASDLNYIIEYQTGQLWVNPAPLTITANNATKVYGSSPISLGGLQRVCQW